MKKKKFNYVLYTVEFEKSLTSLLKNIALPLAGHLGAPSSAPGGLISLLASVGVGNFLDEDIPDPIQFTPEITLVPDTVNYLKVFYFPYRKKKVKVVKLKSRGRPSYALGDRRVTLSDGMQEALKTKPELLLTAMQNDTKKLYLKHWVKFRLY